MRSKFTRKKILVAVAVLLSLFVARYNAHQKSNFVPQKESGLTESTAYVKRVIDGDTVVLDNGERLRYIGINTPEIHHPQKGAEPRLCAQRRGEYYGPQASDFNKRLVLGKNVRLEFDRERFDKYGRLLAYAYLQDGTFVNAELVKQGYARTMTIKPNTKYADLFKRLEGEAKDEKRGMWGR